MDIEKGLEPSADAGTLDKAKQGVEGLTQKASEALQGLPKLPSK